MRPTEAIIDAGAITANVRTVRSVVGDGVELCAVVKADGYGHGSVVAATAALAGGASRLAVALVEEAAVLREAGVTAPILTLSEPHPSSMPEVVALGLEPTVSSVAGVAALATAGGAGRVGVHLKVDTGMHRAGCAPADAVSLADAVAAAGFELAGLFTHCAVADELDDPFTGQQLDRFEGVEAAIRGAGHRPGVVHAANSAGALGHPRARRDMVRCGIALYGIDPTGVEAGSGVDLRPALTLRSAVTRVHRLTTGDTVSYGRRWTATQPTTVALVPIGYADGVRRDLGLRGGAVLVGGERRPVRGVVTMDQLVVDCGDDPVAVGDEVVLIGAQGGERISAEDVAARLGTIGYEVVCAIGRRVPRRPA